MTKFLVLTVFCFYCCIVHAQEDDFIIEAAIISVISFEREDEVFEPTAIVFQCNLSITDDKRFHSFGSNTMKYFRDDEIYKSHKVFGCFYLINQNDTTLLFTREKWQYVAMDGMSFPVSIDYHEGSGPEFLKRFISNDMRAGKKKLHNYLRESKLVYVPIIDDYQYRIEELKLDKEKCIYPTKPFEVKIPQPFIVSFSIEYDGDNYELYSNDFGDMITIRSVRVIGYD